MLQNPYQGTESVSGRQICATSSRKPSISASLIVFGAHKQL